jgi:hypothetical protein
MRKSTISFVLLVAAVANWNAFFLAWAYFGQRASFYMGLGSHHPWLHITTGNFAAALISTGPLAYCTALLLRPNLSRELTLLALVLGFAAGQAYAYFAWGKGGEFWLQFNEDAAVFIVALIAVQLSRFGLPLRKTA